MENTPIIYQGITLEDGKTTYTPDELRVVLPTIIESVKGIVVTDLTDDVQIDRVDTVRKNLGKIRIAIEKQSKEARDGHTKINRDISTVENELVGILSPEETRLKMLISAAKALRVREGRRGFLPMRTERLASIGDGIEVTDDTILDMDEAAFTAYYNQRVTDKVQKDNEERDRVAREERRKIDLEEARQRGVQEAEERAKKTEEDRLKRDAQQKVEAEQRERERIALEKVDSKLQEWKKSITDGEMHFSFKDGTHYAWKLVGTYRESNEA
jgi:hypothetical protein